MATAQSPYQNLINPLDPSSAVNAYQIQRQQALAQALQQQALQPMDADLPKNLPIMPRLGVGHGMVKLAQALMASNATDAVDKNAGEMASKNMGALIKALDPNGEAQAIPAEAAAPAALQLGAATGSIGPTVQNAQTMDAMTAPQPGATGSPLNPVGMNKQLAAYMLMNDPKSFFAAQAEAYKPTDATKMALAAKLDPRQANADALRKVNYIAPESHRPGSFAVNPTTGKTSFFPQIPEGGMPLYDANGNPAGVTDLPGAGGVIGRVEAAKLRGKNSQTLAPAEMSPTLPNGQIVPRSIDETINGPQGLDTSKLTPQQIAALQKADPEAFTNGVARFNGVGPTYGQKEGAVNAQTELSKKFASLNEQNQQAQTTNSYLQNIKSLALKAQAGPMSDRVAYTNALLSYAGLSDKATNELTAKNLLDKYSNQITARLGQGGLGTDAARSIIQSAYPNSKMTPDAINEAVDNLVGANDLIKAKTSLLAQHANERNPKAYTEKEVAFDQNADPRIWQYAAMKPEQRAAFKAKLQQNGEAADFSKRIRNLEALGVKFK